MANTSVDDSIDVTITVIDVNEPPEFDTSAVELEDRRKHLGEYEHRQSDRPPSILSLTS